MSWMTKGEITKRLKSASEESPLAVFRKSLIGRQHEELYDVAFANTVVTQQRIEQDDSLVGVFSSPLQFTEELTRRGLSDAG